MHDGSGQNIARCQTFFEECPDPIVTLSSMRCILDVNRACLDLFGYEREGIIGLDAAPLLCSDPNELHRLQSDIERRGSVKDFEMQFRRKDGMAMKTRMMTGMIVQATSSRVL